MAREERGIHPPHDSLVPFLQVGPHERRVLKEEGWSMAEAYYESAIQRIREDGRSSLVYLCAPLKLTPNKPVPMHIAEAISSASQILGAEYNRKKITVWIPHLHGFSVFNEVIYPEVRERAIAFNSRVLPLFHALIIVGNRVSEGMSWEIALAQRSGLETVTFEDFKGRLQNLPSAEEAERNYWAMAAIHNNIHGPQFLIE